MKKFSANDAYHICTSCDKSASFVFWYIQKIQVYLVDIFAFFFFIISFVSISLGYFELKKSGNSRTMKKNVSHVIITMRKSWFIRSISISKSRTTLTVSLSPITLWNTIKYATQLGLLSFQHDSDYDYSQSDGYKYRSDELACFGSYNKRHLCDKARQIESFK